MANLTNCQSCEELRQTAPNFVVNGLGDTECTSLQNDSGFNPSSGHNDCTDLDNANDCLIGNMEDEVEAYDICEWKPFTRRFISNVWTEFKATICSICGIWTNIHNLWADVKKLQCQVKYINRGASFYLGEKPEGKSYLVAGKGCSFLIPTEGGESQLDFRIIYIAGGLASIASSIRFYTEDFTDDEACYNYDDNGINPGEPSKRRKGNENWGKQGKIVSAGELVFEARIYKPDFPQIRTFYTGDGRQSEVGAFTCLFPVFGEDEYAYGQHGSCHEAGFPNEGEPDREGYSYGHKVPKDWVYIQCRIDYMDVSMQNDHQYSPRGFMGMRVNLDEIPC